MRERGFFENGRAFTSLLALVVGFVHKFFKTRFFKRGNLYDGNTEFFLEFAVVDLVARLLHRVHHVERDNHGNVDFHDLRGKVEVSFEVGRVYDVDDAIRLFVEYVVTGDNLFGGVRRKRVNTRKVHDRYGFGAFFVNAVALVYRDARPVADVRGGSRKAVEQRGFTAVRVACECKSLHYLLTSIVTHTASLLRRVSS